MFIPLIPHDKVEGKIGLVLFDKPLSACDVPGTDCDGCLGHEKKDTGVVFGEGLFEPHVMELKLCF